MNDFIETEKELLIRLIKMSQKPENKKRLDLIYEAIEETKNAIRRISDNWAKKKKCCSL